MGSAPGAVTLPPDHPAANASQVVADFFGPALYASIAAWRRVLLRCAHPGFGRASSDVFGARAEQARGHIGSPTRPPYGAASRWAMKMIAIVRMSADASKLASA